jgi:YD repeat-containing protein
MWVDAESKGTGSFLHDRMGRPNDTSALPIDSSVKDVEYGGVPEYRVSQTVAFDRLGRPVSQQFSTDEPAYWYGSPVAGQVAERNFPSYVYDDTAGLYTRTGPDGQVTQTTTDAAGRVTSITRSGTTGSLSASYTYYNDDRVATITYGNGATTRMMRTWTATGTACRRRRRRSASTPGTIA